MAETTTRQLPAPFIEALGKTYADQLTKQVGKPVDTSKFAPQVAAQDQLQTDAAALAKSGVGSYQPFLTSAQQALTTAGGIFTHHQTQAATYTVAANTGSVMAGPITITGTVTNNGTLVVI